jgi:hypothetical protein
VRAIRDHRRNAPQRSSGVDNRQEGDAVTPSASDLARWRARNLVPGELVQDVKDGVHVAFQSLLPPFVDPSGEPAITWEAWWWDPRTQTAGHLSSAEPMSGTLFGQIVRLEIRRKRASPPLVRVVEPDGSREWVGPYPKWAYPTTTEASYDDAWSKIHGIKPEPVHPMASKADTLDPELDPNQAESQYRRDRAADIAANSLYGKSARDVPPSPPVESWESVTTTPADHEARRARAKRSVRCRHCGRVTGTLSQTCSRPVCVDKTARERGK